MNINLEEQKRHRQSKRHRLLTCGLCIALLGANISFALSSAEESANVKDAEHQLQTVTEEKEVLQREVNKLEIVVANGAFFDSDEWVADEAPYYSVKLSQELQRYTYTKCADLGISEYYELVLAIMWQESNYTPDLISATNDYGLMQINKINHSWLSEELGITDFLDPYQSIDAGTHVVASLLIKYEDPHKALMAYNYGEAGARSHWNRGIYTSSYSRGVAEKQDTLLNQLIIEQIYIY